MWKPQKPPFTNYKREVFQKVGLTADFIYHLGEFEALREKSEPVLENEFGSKNFQKQIAYLKSCMKKFRRLTGMGRGITAVQVGIPKRFAVIYMPKVKGKLFIFVNPKITKKSKEQLLYPEMCMSLNPIIAPVVRPAFIEFEYQDEQGKRQAWVVNANTKEGKLYNRVFQHEIDHMDGVMNIDRVESKKLLFEIDKTFYDKATFTKVQS